MTYKYTHINLTDGFVNFIKDHHLLQPQETTLLAVSGGVDSVVMADLFYQANLPFAMAHCNFGLRGAESEGDEAWVRKLAQQYGVKVYVQHFATQDYAQVHQLSIQMAARELRYRWFEELGDTYHLSKIATAHHANDMVETLLFNLTKGTGLAGLHGILPRQGKLIRPLLFATKESIVAYAQAHNLIWREDSSNAQDNYARNLIRNQVIPVLKSINPQLEATTHTTITRLSQVEVFVTEQLASLQQAITYEQDGITYLAIQAIKTKPWAPAILWEMLKPFGFNFLQISSLLESSSASGKMIESATHQIYVDRTTWMLSQLQQPARPLTYMIERETTHLSLPAYSLQIRTVPSHQYHFVADSQVAALDVAKLQFPLVVRPWQPGDFFYPLGMQKRKKLSNFLIDCKVPVLVKEKVTVLVSGNDIVWVVGYRIDDRFKITEATEQVCEIRLMGDSLASN